MKKVIFTLILSCSYIYLLFAQTVNIPDPVLKNILLNNHQINTNKDSNIQTSEALNTTQIKINDYTINSLEGLEEFVNLKVLSASIGKPIDLDIKKLTELEELYLNNNELQQIDLSSNVALKILNLSNNKLSQLDLSKNTLLETLYLSDNRLINLNVTNNPNLTMLHFMRNSVETIDLSKNRLLSDLKCNNNRLRKLNLSANDSLHTLWCEYNRTSSLELGEKPKLKSLKVGHNMLTTLDTEKFSELIDINCNANLLTEFKVNASLKVLTCQSNKFEYLDLSKNEHLTSLDCSFNSNLKEICVHDQEQAALSMLFKKDAAAIWTESCKVITNTLSGQDKVQAQIYPNPAKHTVYLGEKALDVIVYNGRGQMVIRDHTDKINVSLLEPGIYQVILSSEASTVSHKLIIE